MAAIISCRAEFTALSERDRTLLRSLLAATQARTGMRWDGGANHTVVHFIDVDNAAGADFFRSLKDSERRESAIVLSSAAQPGAVRWLAKPLRSATLLDVLSQLSLANRSSAPAAAVTPLASSNAAALPDNTQPMRLLDLLDGRGIATAQAVQSPHWPDLVLGSGNRHVMRTAPIEAYIDGFAISTEFERLGKYAGGPLDDEQRLDLAAVRWLVLLHAPWNEIATRVRKPAGRVRLASLPAFGQLPHSLQHVRMAAWLTQHPASIEEIAEVTQADEESVTRFLAACDALELLRDVFAEPERPITAMAAPAMPAETEAAVIEAPIAVESLPVAEAEALMDETAPAAPASAGSDGLSVLERLRATREQNRARVVAAIRNASTT